ncbi:hypothetical protein [Leptospira alexanderi]|uniref:hypothetical protein n=1 Tax=Leptospira alexanderi TaxID=100053 RepID=UPI00058774B3|nr:hypothetical protein [Leptospira alexanderi]
MKKFIHLFRYTFFVISLLVQTNCLLEEAGTISGTEANQIITERVLVKMYSCGLVEYSYDRKDTNPDLNMRALSKETTNIFFLMTTIFVRFEAFGAYERYKSKDIYACADDLDLVRCEVIESKWATDSNMGGMIGGLICNDVKKQ